MLNSLKIWIAIKFAYIYISRSSLILAEWELVGKGDHWPEERRNLQGRWLCTGGWYLGAWCFDLYVGVWHASLQRQDPCRRDLDTWLQWKAQKEPTEQIEETPLVGTRILSASFECCSLSTLEPRSVANFKYVDDPLADAFVGLRWENVSPQCKDWLTCSITVNVRHGPLGARRQAWLFLLPSWILCKQHERYLKHSENILTFELILYGYNMDVRMHYATQYFISMHAFVFGVLTVFLFRTLSVLRVPGRIWFEDVWSGSRRSGCSIENSTNPSVWQGKGTWTLPFLLQHCYISLFIPTKFLGMNTIPRNIALWSSTLRLTAAGVQMHPWLCQVASAQMPLMSLAPVLKAPFFFFQP